jgi:uncharacterized damage-inducible protein DinB
MIETYRTEFRRYHGYVEAILDQVDQELLNRLPVKGGNSIAMLIRHLSGNLHSRFTQFLSTDGEKSWRDREGEFEPVTLSVETARALWEEAYTVLDDTLASLEASDLDRSITIRGQSLTVRAALLRSLAHLGYHVGQMTLMARVGCSDEWVFMTIPPGQTASYNKNPTKELG